MKTIKHNQETLYLVESKYAADSSTAIELVLPSGEPYAVLTVCIPEVGTYLGPNEILVKTWSENMPIRASALASPYFTDTGKRVPTGFVEAEIWKYV